MLEAGLFSGQLCVGGSLRAGQLGRLGLVQRLMAAQEAAGALNDPGLCLQCVVLAYCCLAPLMQQQVATPQVSLVSQWRRCVSPTCHMRLCSGPGEVPRCAL